jgi:hypothetical protein
LSLHTRGSLAVAISLLALSPYGCGGGSDNSNASTGSTSSSSEAPASREDAKATAAEGKQDPASGHGTEGEQQGSTKQTPRRIKVTLPPISSAAVAGSKHPAPGVKTTKGGDNSVQGYGVESSDPAREEAALALQAYLDSRLEEDWTRACSLLAQRPREQFEEQFAQSQSAGPGEPAHGCAGAMAAISKEAPRAALRESAQIAKVLSFRVQGNVPGDPSFLLYLGLPGRTLYSMPMYLEGGEWKVGLVLPSELPV